MEYETRYTSAPEDYDGFGTHTTETEIATTRKGEVVREVAIDQAHLNWQTMRYSSGLYACLTEAQLREAIEMKLYASEVHPLDERRASVEAAGYPPGLDYEAMILDEQDEDDA